MKVVLVSMTQAQVEQPIIGVLHANEPIGVLVAEEIPNNVNEASNVVNEVRHPLTPSFPPLRGTPATVSESSSSATVLQDFLVPPNQTSLSMSESAPSLQETSSISVDSRFSSTEKSADLKYLPLEYTPAPSEVPPLSDIESSNTDNLHISHVSFFSSIVHVLQTLFSLF